ncbi:MAG: response regulator [Cyanobacteria bacterium P01_H01_bin.121]
MSQLSDNYTTESAYGLACDRLDVLTQFAKLRDRQFTGCLVVRAVELKVAKQVTWRFYFRLGYLIWQTGGPATLERWQRQLQRYCPQIELEQFTNLDVTPGTHRERAGDSHDINHCTAAKATDVCKSYAALADLLDRRLILRSQAKQLTTARLVEAIFDALQWERSNIAREFGQGGRSVQTALTSLASPTKLLTLIDTRTVVEQAWQAWQVWKRAGLAAHSPNAFPTIRDLDALETQNVSEFCFQVLQTVDGTRSLRQLAALNQRGLVDIGTTLLPFIQVKAIALASEPMPTKFKVVFSEPPSSLAQPRLPAAAQPLLLPMSGRPRVACIDDSVAAGKRLATILQHYGCECLSWTDAFQALVALLRWQPQLIFLDFMLPTMNGAELCGRIRSVPRLAVVPIVVLSSNAAMAAQNREHFAGPVEFLAKPAVDADIAAVLTRYGLTEN